MVMIRLEHIDPLLNATSVIAQISNTADVRISPATFSIITSNPSPPFFATLQIQRHFFVYYSVHQNHSRRMFIPSFRGAMLEGRYFPFMSIQLNKATTGITLRFETPNYEPQLQREVTLSSSAEEDVGKVNEEKFFLISAYDFRRIIRELAIYYHRPVHVTRTDSQIKFHVENKEIILCKERGQCVIVGYQGEAETKFDIYLRPMLFFLNLSHQSDRVWFFKTTDSRSSVICVPAYGLYAQYLIYYPEM